jgi:hypothetical protein
MKKMQLLPIACVYLCLKFDFCTTIILELQVGSNLC